MDEYRGMMSGLIVFDPDEGEWTKVAVHASLDELRSSTQPLWRCPILIVTSTFSLCRSFIVVLFAQSKAAGED